MAQAPRAAQDVKKKVKPLAIEIDATEPALEVHYEVQEVVVGTEEVVSTSRATKKITVKSLDASTDLAALAADIVDKCKLIHPSKTWLVEELLQKLRQRAVEAVPAPTLDLPGSSVPPGGGGGSAHRGRSADAARDTGAEGQHRHTRPEGGRADTNGNAGGGAGVTERRPPQQQQQQQQQQHKMQGRQQHQEPAREAPTTPFVEAVLASIINEGLPVVASGPAAGGADLADLEGYIEALYEDDVAPRAAAASRIAALFVDLRNIQGLVTHPSLLPTLARVLREDGRRSLEVAAAVASTFFGLSAMRQLHQTIRELQVGATLLELCQLEVTRTAQRMREDGLAASPASQVARMIAAATRAGPPLTEREVRASSLLQRQQRFLLPAIGLLANLAEDPGVQRKMAKNDLPALLVSLLGYPSLELNIAVLELLRRMAIYTAAVLRLANNLALDTKTRRQMVAAGLVPRLSAVLLQVQSSSQLQANSATQAGGTASQLQPLALGLLYLASMDHPARSLVAASDLLPRLIESLLRAPDMRAVPELIALVVNLCAEPNTAEWFCVGERLDRLLARAMQGDGDELAFKLVHNLATAGCKPLADKLAPHVPQFVHLLQRQPDCAELCAEVLGTLVGVFDALPLGPVDWESPGEGREAETDARATPSWNTLLIGCDVFELLSACLAESLGDDTLLAAVGVTGVLAGHAALAQQLADSGVLLVLSTLMADKCRDDEFVLQASWAFARAFMQQPTRDQLLGDTQVVAYLVDLLADPSPAVRVAASAGLDAIIDADTEQDGWAQRLRMLKFEAHNQVWLSMMQDTQQDGTDGMLGSQQQQQQHLHHHHQQQQQQQQTAAIFDGYGGDGDNGEAAVGLTLKRPGAALGQHAPEPTGPAAAGGAHLGAVDYGLYATGQQLVVDIQSYQLEAEARHQQALLQAAGEDQEGVPIEPLWPGAPGCEGVADMFGLGMGIACDV